MFDKTAQKKKKSRKATYKLHNTYNNRLVRKRENRRYGRLGQVKYPVFFDNSNKLFQFPNKSNMSQIKDKDTKPEIMVRKFLFAKGFRYRLHDKRLPGKPDIVFPRLKTVIFVHGCFWHGHQNCPYFVLPKTRTDWWLNKINRNKEVDERNLTELLQSGWIVLTVFRCELKIKNTLVPHQVQNYDMK